MIVVDVGCATIGADESVRTLIGRYKPRLLFGFDPHEHDRVEEIDGCLTVISSAAAWTRTGTVGFAGEGLRAHIDAAAASHAVCFDLASFLLALPGRPVVKLDCEGAEHDLVDRLVATCTDSIIDRLLVEWHGQPSPSAEALCCPLEPW